MNSHEHSAQHQSHQNQTIVKKLDTIIKMPYKKDNRRILNAIFSPNSLDQQTSKNTHRYFYQKQDELIKSINNTMNLQDQIQQDQFPPKQVLKLQIDFQHDRKVKNLLIDSTDFSKNGSPLSMLKDQSYYQIRQLRASSHYVKSKPKSPRLTEKEEKKQEPYASTPNNQTGYQNRLKVFKLPLEVQAHQHLRARARERVETDGEALWDGCIYEMDRVDKEVERENERER